MRFKSRGSQAFSGGKSREVIYRTPYRGGGGDLRGPRWVHPTALARKPQFPVLSCLLWLSVVGTSRAHAGFINFMLLTARNGILSVKALPDGAQLEFGFMLLICAFCLPAASRIPANRNLNDCLNVAFRLVVSACIPQETFQPECEAPCAALDC